jgi:hypothetical protein
MVTQSIFREGSHSHIKYSVTEFFGIAFSTQASCNTNKFTVDGIIQKSLIDTEESIHLARLIEERHLSERKIIYSA